jgi:predicted ribosomally synthesized peptide with nif11-like leader
MSREAVIKLIESAENDPNLRKQLSSAQGPETVIKIAQEKGYQFTEAELIEVMQEKQLSFTSEEELSEEQLEAVVGGKSSESYSTKGGAVKVYRTPDGDVFRKVSADVYRKS